MAQVAELSLGDFLTKGRKLRCPINVVNQAAVPQAAMQNARFMGVLL
jgi:hypothetical protein